MILMQIAHLIQRLLAKAFLLSMLLPSIAWAQETAVAVKKCPACEKSFSAEDAILFDAAAGLACAGPGRGTHGCLFNECLANAAAVYQHDPKKGKATCKTCLESRSGDLCKRSRTPRTGEVYARFSSKKKKTYILQVVLCYAHKSKVSTGDAICHTLSQHLRDGQAARLTKSLPILSLGGYAYWRLTLLDSNGQFWNSKGGWGEGRWKECTLAYEDIKKEISIEIKWDELKWSIVPSSGACTNGLEKS